MSLPLQITVVYSPAARQVMEVMLSLQPGSTAGDAVHGSGLRARYADLDLKQAWVGVWGRKVPLDRPLRDGDRVEIYRALKVDPKVARRERFNRQGAKKAGLFVKRREGAKAGY